MPEIMFYGDPHGDWLPLLDECAYGARPDAVVLLGDMDLARPLHVELAPIVAARIPVWWIPGNHDSDRVEWFERLYDSDLGDRNLHGRVVDVAGVKIAGLGGVFREEVWRPGPAGGVPRFRTRAAYAAHRREQRLPPHRHVMTTIFPEDVAVLVDQEADLLVTHEAPSCIALPALGGGLPFELGFEQLDTLGEALGVRTIVHGHHHYDYEAELRNGIKVKGVGKATVWRLQIGYSLEDGPPVEGSGDFLSDMGYPDPAAARRRFALCAELREAVTKRFGSVAAAAAATGVVEAELAAAVRGGGDRDDVWLASATDVIRRAK